MLHPNFTRYNRMRDIGIRFHSCYKFLEWKRFRNLLKNPISVLCPTVRFHSFLKYILSLLLHCEKLKLSKFIIFFFLSLLYILIWTPSWLLSITTKKKSSLSYVMSKTPNYRYKTKLFFLLYCELWHTGFHYKKKSLWNFYHKFANIFVDLAHKVRM
jgi:hypothetical protein